MKKRTAAAAAALGLAAVVTGGGMAVAGGGDDGELHVTPEQAAQAKQAALAATDGGTANSVEKDSENGATWEVEVTRTDGVTVDVRLDEGYGVVVIEGDSEAG